MFKNIVATLVGSPEGERALETAVRLAADSGAALHFIAILGQPRPSSGFARAVSPEASRLLDEDQVTLEENLRQRAEQQASGKGIKVTSSRIEDHLVEGVLEIARDRKADLLIVGLQRPTFHVGRLWSKVSELAEEAPCCILGVP